MNRLRKVGGYWAGAFTLLSLVLGLAGCETPTFNEELPGLPVAKGATNAAGTNVTSRPPRPGNTPRPLNVFRVGDAVVITFSGMEPKIDPHQEIIKDDGTITPPEIGKSIIATNKTSAELQQELLPEYKKKYVHPQLNINPAPRFFYMTGDVLRPGPQQYLGETTIVQAIAAAGGPSEFAKKSDIQLTRVGSQKLIHINYKKALAGDAKHNLPIAPGDTVFVPRSLF